MTHGITLKKNQRFLLKINILSDLNDIQPRAIQVWNYDEIEFIPMEGETRSSVLTSYFKVNECERHKLELVHHSGAH